MSNGKWWGIGIAAVVVLCVWTSYNGLVTGSEAVNVGSAQVAVQLKRQADLLPNLVETVKGYAKFESDTMKAVAEARAQVTAVSKIDPAKMANDPEAQKQIVEAQASMQQAMVKLNAAREAYPDLKANTNFTALMAEIAGTQNRITVARKRWQDSVNDWNVRVQRFPTVVVARLAGYSTKPYFEVSAEEQVPPKIKF